MMKTDTNIFANNITALEQRYPELADRVKNCKIVNYELFQQEGCICNVMHTILDEPWYTGNLSQYFDKQWEGLKFSNVKYPMFLGFGLGYEVQYFLTKYGKEHCVQGMLIIERDIELFTAALNVTDITELLSKPAVHFVVGVPLQDVYLFGRDFFFKNIKDMLFCGTLAPVFSSMAFKIDKKYYMTFISNIYESCWDSIHNYGNCPEDSLVGLENMLDNVAEIVSSPGINLLYDKFKNKPAIIVATGPSLKKNIHLLKGLEDKALIVSVDASLKLLLANGIKPHMVTSLEREHEVEQFFNNLDPQQVEDVYMTTCPVLYNHVYESYNGPKIMAYRNFDHFKWLGIDKGILDIKLSSANMAFKIADALGCNPIILVGQDLAYGDNDETHATEVPFSSAGENIFNVRGNYVDEIKTNDGWQAFLKAFEIDISQYKGKCFNCTDGGAFIKGTFVESLQTLIDCELQNTINPLDIIKKPLSEFSGLDIQQDLECLRATIVKTKTEVQEIINLCREGATLCNDIPENPKDILIRPRMDIQTKYTDTFQKFLMHIVQSVHLVFEMQYAIEPKSPLEWYAFIGDISDICLQSLIKAEEKINNMSGGVCGCPTESITNKACL